MHDTIGTRRVTRECDRRIGRGDEIRGRGGDKDRDPTSIPTQQIYKLKQT